MILTLCCLEYVFRVEFRILLVVIYLKAVADRLHRFGKKPYFF